MEDLKIQLDDALGAEDMLELLTEKNLAMGEVRRIAFPLRNVSLMVAFAFTETRGTTDRHRGLGGATRAQR